MRLEDELNPEQVEAVTHGSGPQLVLAGAGSGKTRVITYRIAWLVRERSVEPWQIAAVTFTNKAATEMRERAESLLQRRSEGLFVGTFHRFALLLLRRYGEDLGLARGFGIADSSDQLSLVKKALEAEHLSETAFPPRAVLSRISAAKSRLVRPERFEAEADGFFERKIAPVYYRYEGLLRDAASLDFDDLILLAVRLLREEEEVAHRVTNRLHHLLVDEYQDTNYAQLELIRSLFRAEGGSLTAVGDEDQGIYRWRGAELSNILEFESSFPGAVVRKLERNYRSTQNILDASGALIAHNERRRGKRLWTDVGGGEALELYRAADELEEARWVVQTLRSLHGQHRYREMAILVRTNAQTRALEDELLRRSVPYCLVAGVRFYDRAEIKDLLAYLRLVQQPGDNLSLGRVLNKPTRGIGRATRQQLEQEAAQMGHSLWDVLRLGRLGGVSARGTRALLGFKSLVEDLRGAAERMPLPELLEYAIQTTGFGELYSGGDPDSASRRENLGELVSAAQELVELQGLQDEPSLDDDGSGPLIDFLDHVSLISDVDGLDAEKGVSLMTLHSAKGLEFPVVVVTGLEDGLLPHFNAQQTQDEIEEERRLLYVGMTRAERRLFLTCCRRRRVAGRYQDQRESPFVGELPGDLLEIQESPSLFADHRTEGVYRFFGRDTSAVGPHEGGNELGKGSRVRHATLGEGTVLEMDGDGEGAKVTVFFDRVGKRRLVARYAGLEPL